MAAEATALRRESPARECCFLVVLCFYDRQVNGKENRRGTFVYQYIPDVTRAAAGVYELYDSSEAKGSACIRNPVFHLGNPVYLSCSAESSAACSGSDSDPLQRVLQYLACEEELQEI